MALPVLVGVPLLWLSTRWYLKRAPDGYLAERAAYAELNGSDHRDGRRRADRRRAEPGRAAGPSGRSDDLRGGVPASSGTRWGCGCVWFPTVELTYLLPVALCLLWGGFLVAHGHASVAAVTAVTLYVVQLVDPVDELLSWLDEVQVGAASLGRIIGVATVPPGPHRRAARSRSTSGSWPRTRRTPTARATTCCTGSR